MANLRTIKKDIAYHTGEVISNCYMALYFQGEEAQEPLTKVIEQAIELYNDLTQRANHPAEKHNAKLVRKHYTAINADLYSGIEKLFAQISEVCSK